MKRNHPDLMEHMQRQPESIGGGTLSVLSLFSGCGGMDLGLEGGFPVHKASVNPLSSQDFIGQHVDDDFVRLKKTRFETVFANDILDEAKTAWRHNFPKRNHDAQCFRNESIVDLVRLHEAGGKIFPSNVDVVTGGFPCQDFSLAGKRKGFNSHKDHYGNIIQNETASDETRGNLYMWMKKVIEITQPKIFIAENVKGLVNMSNVKEVIQKDFSSSHGNGYIVLEPKVLHAADYGVPQSRERIIFIGIKKSALNKHAYEQLTKTSINQDYNPYPPATHAFTSNAMNLAPPQTLRNVLAFLREPGESDDLSQKYFSKAKYMGTHCQGQKEIDLNGIGPTIRSEHHGNIEYRRLSINHGGKILAELDAGLPERRLTPRECAQIQTFPTDFDFVIPKPSGTRFILSPTGAYKIIGNAVPPLLAYNLGKRIEKLWEMYFD